MKALSIPLAPASVKTLVPVPCVVGKGENENSTLVYVYGDDDALVTACLQAMKGQAGGEIIEGAPPPKPVFAVRPGGISKMNFEPVPVTPENTIWALDPVQAYRSVGMTPFRMPHGKKKMTLPWPNNDPIDLAKDNVGCVPGEGIVDLDLDWPRAHVFAKILMPPTKVFGRKSSPFAHFLYKTTGVKAQPFLLPKSLAPRVTPKRDHEFTILELRSGAGLYTLFPPSVHDSGEQLFFETNNAVREVEADYLKKRAGLVALCTMFDDMWAGGMRHHLLLALMGLLRRAGVTRAEAVEIKKAICKFNGDTEDLKDRDRVLDETFGRNDDTLPPLDGISSWKFLEDDRIGFTKAEVTALKKWFPGAGREREEVDIGDALCADDVIPNIAPKAWDALKAKEVDGSPLAYSYGDRLATVDLGKINVLDVPRLTYEMNRVAQYCRAVRGRMQPCDVPQNLVGDMLATPKSKVPLPKIKSVVNVPVFAGDGRLLQKPGYDEGSQLFYAPSIEIAPVSPEPTDDELTTAREALLEVIEEFPFDHESDKAHMIALMLQHFARELWTGPSSAYYIWKPSPKAGASLLVKIATMIALGEPVGSTTLGTNDDETRKKLTAGYMQGAKFYFFDNCTYIGGESLASAITSTWWYDRVLGSSVNFEGPALATFIFTGISPKITEEMVRRVKPQILLIPQDEMSVEHVYKIPLLEEYVREHRARLVHACLTIIQAWIARGRVMSNKSLASFEKWSAVMGGILDCASIDGFLETPADRNVEVEDDGATWAKAFALRWSRSAMGLHPDVKNYQLLREEVSASTLLAMCTESKFDIRWEATEKRFDATAFGKLVSRYQNRVFAYTAKDGHQVKLILKARSKNNALRYSLEGLGAQLEEAGGEPDVPF